MEYKLYLSGIGLDLDLKSLHKNNAEIDLKKIKNLLESNTLENISELNLDTINEKFKYFLLLGSTLIIKDSNENILHEIDLLEEFNKSKYQYDLFKYKENNIVIESNKKCIIKEHFIGTFYSSSFNINDIEFNNVILYENMFVINKLFIKMESFNINFEEENYVLTECFLKKYNKNGFPLIKIDNKEIFDLFINKYSNKEEFLVNQKMIVLSTTINFESFLSVNDNIKNFISENFNIYLKESIEEVFGLEIISMKVFLNNQYINVLNEKELYNINLKINKDKKIEILIEILFKSNIQLSKAIFLNKISSIIGFLEYISIFITNNSSNTNIEQINFNYGFIANSLLKKTESKELNFLLKEGF